MAKAEVSKLINIAQALEDSEQYDKAIVELSKAHSIEPNNTDVIQMIAHNYQILKKDDEALGWWEKFVYIEPNNPVIYDQLIDLYFSRNKFKYYMSRAKLKIIEQKNSQAISDLKKAISNTIEPNEIVEARLMLATLFEAASKPMEAIDEYVRILDVKDSVSIYYRLAELYQLEDDYDAIAILERGLEAHPDEEGFKEMLAQLYLKTNQPDKALKYVQNDLTRAKIYLSQGENERALEILKPAAVSKGNEAEYHALIAEYYFNKNEWDKAQEEIEKFLKSDPKSPLPYQMKALIAEAQNKDFEAHINWAKYYEMRGKTDVALDELHHAHLINSQDAGLIRRIIAVYRNLNDYHSIVEFSEKLYKIDDKDTDALRTLGEFYAKEGEYSSAVEYFEKLYVLKKGDLNNLKSLADAYEKSRDWENAKKAWEKYLSLAPMSPETDKIKSRLEKMDGQQTPDDSSEGFFEKIFSLFAKK